MTEHVDRILKNMTLRWLQVFTMLQLVIVPSLLAVPVESNQSYLHIQRSFLAEKFDRVVQEAPKLLDNESDTFEATKIHIWWALSLEKMQRYNDALRVFDQLQKRIQSADPLWAEASFWEGEVSRRSSRMVRAKLAYQRLLEREPKSTWAARAEMGLGLVYLHQQAFQTAAEKFRQVRVHSLSNKMTYEASLFEGFCYLRLNRFKEAIAVVKPILKSARDSGFIAQAAFYSGESYLGLTEYEKAVHAYLRAINPLKVKANLELTQDANRWAKLAYFGAGWSLYRMDRCQESMDYLERYLHAHGTEQRVQANFGLASCHVQVGEEKKALEYFEGILTEYPQHALAAQSGLAAAAIYQAQGNLDMAKLILRAVLRQPLLSEDRSKLLVHLGTVVMGLGDPAQAKTILASASNIKDPATKQLAMSVMADAHLKLGELEEAAMMYEVVVKMESQTQKGVPGEIYAGSLAEYAAYQNGRIYLEQEKYDKAAEVFQHLIVSAKPERAYESRLALAITYLNQKQRDLAQVQLQAIRKHSPNSDVAARAAYYLGLLALERGNNDSAERYCREVIDVSPKSSEAVEASFLLADLLVQRRSIDMAIKTLKSAYQSNYLVLEQQARAAKRLGDLTRNQGLCAQAIQWYDKARKLQSSLSGELDYRIASCFEEFGDVEMAINRYLANQDEMWQMRAKLAAAKLLEREDRTQEAQEVYESLSAASKPEAKIAEERLANLRELVAAKER